MREYCLRLRNMVVTGTIKEELCAAMDTMIEEVNVVLVFLERETRMKVFMLTPVCGGFT